MEPLEPALAATMLLWDSFPHIGANQIRSLAYNNSSWFGFVCFFLFSSETESGEGAETDKIPSRLPTIGTELDPRKCEIMT